jgi:hypothetical protein
MLHVHLRFYVQKESEASWLREYRRSVVCFPDLVKVVVTGLIVRFDV